MGFSLIKDVWIMTKPKHIDRRDKDWKDIKMSKHIDTERYEGLEWQNLNSMKRHVWTDGHKWRITETD